MYECLLIDPVHPSLNIVLMGAHATYCFDLLGRLPALDLHFRRSRLERDPVAVVTLAVEMSCE